MLLGEQTELGAKVNTDIKQPVRALPASTPTLALCAHDRTLMRAHLLAAVRIALAFDARWQFWTDEFLKCAQSGQSAPLETKVLTPTSPLFPFAPLFHALQLRASCI